MSLDFDAYDEDELDEMAAEDDSSERLAEFEDKVDKRIRFLLSPKSKKKPEQRIRVAYWLGESGSPKAIQALRRVYDREKENKSLRKAVEYALGQFKALDRSIQRGIDEPVEEALGREENAHIRELLMDIALEGKTGKQKLVPLPLLLALQLVLVISLVALIFLNITNLDSGTEAETTPMPTTFIPPEQAAVIDALNQLQYYVNWNRDAVSLQTQFGNATEGMALVCDPRFAMRDRYELPEQAAAAYPELVELAETVNDLSTKVNEAINEHNLSCDNHEGQTTVQLAGQFSSELIRASDQLPELDNMLSMLIEQAREAAVDSAGVLVMPPTSAPVPPTEDYTIGQNAVQKALAELQRITFFNRSSIETLKPQFDALASGIATELDCGQTMNVSSPFILADYETALAVFPDLANLATRVNLMSVNATQAATEHNDACQNRSGQSSPERAQEIASLLGDSLAVLPDLETTLATLGIQVQDASFGSEGELILPTLAPTEPIGPTIEPTVMPTETADPVELSEHIRQLDFKIAMVNGAPNRSLPLLRQYWNDLNVSGRTEGCNVAEPNIPEDYGDVLGDLAIQVPTLVEAQAEVNAALQLLRDSRALFYDTCATGALPTQETIDLGLQQIVDVETALNTANGLLEAIRP